ncbi:hypothetical protein ACLOAV_001721 [Pseudogymnoascus australis]
MTHVMNLLTDKPGWHVDVFNDSAVEAWRAEMEARYHLLSARAWAWCLAELRDKARVWEATALIRVLDTGSCVLKSDSRVPAALGAEMRRCCEVLGAEMGEAELVDPSLYPLVYGRTRVLVDGGRVGVDFRQGEYGSGTPAPVYPTNAPLARDLAKMERGEERPFEECEVSRRELGGMRWSARFQWLPAEVEFVGGEGCEVRIASYVNNLSPVHHGPLYGAIERLISLAIEPWNKCIIKGRSGPVPLRIRTYGAVFRKGEGEEKPRGTDEFERSEVGDEELEEDTNEREHSEAGDEEAGDEDSGDEVRSLYNENEVYSESEDEEENYDKREHPEPGTAYSYDDWKHGRNGKAIIDMDPSFHARYSVPPDHVHDMYEANLQSTFRAKGLQVVVKISSIELSPSQPSIPSGEWTLNGALNDHIVATALYIYSSSNVTESHLSFRQEMWSHPESYSCYSDHPFSYAAAFGLSPAQYENGPSMQDLGRVALPQGRLLTWPNTLQHRFEPVALLDKSKPGHRRFITLMLVDPHYRVCSTRNVPPQRHEWWAEAVRASADLARRGVPREVADLVMGFAEEEGGRGEAEAWRREVRYEHRWVNRVVEERAWKVHGCYCMNEE